MVLCAPKHNKMVLCAPKHTRWCCACARLQQQRARHAPRRLHLVERRMRERHEARGVGRGSAVALVLLLPLRLVPLGRRLVGRRRLLLLAPPLLEHVEQRQRDLGAVEAE
eukprot:4454448-Prymnesium_polylepis.3